MKTMKKFKLSLANDIEKEANWLTEMSAKGWHFVKYKWGFYYFEENLEISYIYQVDFQEATDEYFDLYKQVGWEHMHTEVMQFHYFRADTTIIGNKRIYSDPASIKGMYKRMFSFYLVIFACMLVTQIGLLLTWDGNLFSKFVLALVTAVLLLYVYLFIKLTQQMKKNEKLI
ncbi:DUF2812 domain-containing protein [Planococcus kocurii]|uniref:DUF2812 domain-containing protein n=1 Tax=Planococcus kocurii TaxID=1374 RepID=A0ABM5X197_9BACL|nr:DUF2812 domain-containing protein [Planococcus kocurii]ALS79565.1 hypothetical protein AUO94_13440 [Planococcus kocurii]